MRGSFHKQTTWVEKVIAQSQKEWRRGYDAGLASKNPSAWKYFSGSSPSFVDGWKRGQAKRQGEVPPILAVAPNIDQEVHARQEYSRGVFMNRNGMHVSERVLATCHPEFIRGYRRDILDIQEELEEERDCQF